MARAGLCWRASLVFGGPVPVCCSGAVGVSIKGHILESFSKHSDSISVEVQSVIQVPGSDGGVVCQVDVGEGGAAPGDLHVDVMYDMWWGVCPGQEGGDHNS